MIIQAASWWSTSEFNNSQIASRIDNAQNVFEQYLTEKERLLSTAARVLTADFGFKQAVSSRDAETITSVLLNHGQRIEADLMLLTDLEGKLVSSSLKDFQFDSSQQTSLTEQQNTQFIMFNNKLYQLLELPVKAPRVIAHAFIGFEIDSTVVEELKRLTSLDISFFDNNNRVIVSTITHANKQPLKDYLATATLPWLFRDRPAYANRKLGLDSHYGQPFQVFLTADLSSTYQEYDALISTITIIASLIMLVAILISGLFAKNLTQPLSHLVELAKEFAQGKYSYVTTDTKMSREVSTLFDAFSDMGKEIDLREQHILHQAQHDTLTQLFNLHTFRSKLNKTLPSKQAYLLVAIDIRGFSNLNDVLGIQVADECLRALAKRLTEFSIPNCLHARLHGDVFTSLIPLQNEKEINSHIESYTAMLAEPLQVRRLSLNLKFWIGITTYPNDSNDPQALFQRTMLALDNAKKENTTVRFYQEGEEEARLEHLKIVESLKEALASDDGQLYMNYQPKLNLKTNKIDKVEALIRWQHPEMGFVSPELFVNYAEQTGIIFDLTSWVINSTIKQLSEWQQQNIFIEIAINISAQDFSHPEFYNQLKATTDKYKVSPQHITLEITERDLMEDEKRTIALLQELKDTGYTISVDDYGIGQSSLAKLKELPVKELKIDKAFVMELHKSESDQIIVSSTIELGHRLNLSVVAEGVENEQSLALLKDMDCDHIQGYHLAKPLTAKNFVSWLNDYEQTNA